MKIFDFFSGKQTIQIFDDKKLGRIAPQILHFNSISSVDADHLSWLNQSGAGIYFCPNETDGEGRKASNVIKIRAAFADLDGAPLGVAMNYAPSIIVESSPSRYHCYWLTNDTPIEAFTVLQKSIIRAIKSDPSIHDLSRVLRVPGYYHMKGDPFLVNICSISNKAYTYRELVEMFPPEKVKMWSAPRYTVAKPGINTGEFRGTRYGASAGERNAIIMKRIGGMIKSNRPMSYIEEEIRKEGMACNPPLPDSEIKALMRSARRYVA